MKMNMTAQRGIDTVFKKLCLLLGENKEFQTEQPY